MADSEHKEHNKPIRANGSPELAPSSAAVPASSSADLTPMFEGKKVPTAAQQVRFNSIHSMIKAAGASLSGPSFYRIPLSSGWLSVLIRPTTLVIADEEQAAVRAVYSEQVRDEQDQPIDRVTDYVLDYRRRWVLGSGGLIVGSEQGQGQLAEVTWLVSPDSPPSCEYDPKRHVADVLFSPDYEALWGIELSTGFAEDATAQCFNDTTRLSRGMKERAEVIHLHAA